MILLNQSPIFHPLFHIINLIMHLFLNQIHINLNLQQTFLQLFPLKKIFLLLPVNRI